VVNIRVAREVDHLFQAEVLLHPLHVTSEDHWGGKYRGGQGWSEQRITWSNLKSFSTLCMILVKIIWANIGVVRAKDHLFQSEVLFHPLHVTSEDHKGGKHKSGVARANATCLLNICLEYLKIQ
jgi:hypothetical protein